MDNIKRAQLAGHAPSLEKVEDLTSPQLIISFNYKQIKLAIESPSRSFIMRTPWVWRPRVGISLTSTRMTWDFLEMATTSARVPSKTLAEISTPVLAVTLAVLMPLPPRFWTLYSSTSVRLP